MLKKQNHNLFAIRRVLSNQILKFFLVIFSSIVTSTFLLGQGQTNDSVTVLFSVDASELMNKDDFGTALKVLAEGLKAYPARVLL